MYKAFNSDLKCNGFQFEIGEEYDMGGDPELCSRGFHFCREMQNFFNYYPMTS